MERINRFGTTKDMIIQEIQEDGVTSLLAIDAGGLYITSQDRVGTKMADVNRYAVDRGIFLDRLEKLGFSPVDLFEQNKGRIQVTAQTAKKINPLKASKRGLSR